MEQKSEAWHAARRGKINASGAGALLGLSKYTSAKAARKKWVAVSHGEAEPDLSFSPDVQRGVELEPAILDKLEASLGTLIQQDGGRVYQDWMRASADGFDDTHVFEVKAPRQFFELADRPDYALQLYLQMVAYGMKVGVFAQGVVVGGELEVRLGKYTRPELKDIIGIPYPVKVLKVLWEEMKAEEPQEAAEAPEAFESLQDSYLIAKRALADAQAVVDDFKAKLLAACDNHAVVGSKLQVIESTRKGSVNYRALTKDHPELDLDQYRGEPTTSLSIREVK